MISKYIDYIQSESDSYEEYLRKAKDLKVRCVFANMFQAEFALNYLKDTKVIVAGAVDFPLGKSCIEANLKDIENLYNLGIREVDYVLNQYAIENHDFEYIKSQMKTIADYCRKQNITDKAIVEMCKLDAEAKKKVCEIAAEVKPAFLKTSTGKSFSGAKLDDVMLMKSILKDNVKIKAAGGIKTYAFAKELIEAGADALGASAAINIINEEKAMDH